MLVERPVTIVTGASRGIGAATALHLARVGHDVVVNYLRNHDGAQRVVQAAGVTGRRVVAVQANVTDEDDVDRLFTVAHEQLGRPITGLVNNAGVTAHISDLADTPVGVLRQVLDLNLPRGKATGRDNVTW